MKFFVTFTIVLMSWSTLAAVDYCDKSLCTGFDGEVLQHIACNHNGVNNI